MVDQPLKGVGTKLPLPLPDPAERRGGNARLAGSFAEWLVF